eukprot:Gb_22440 [translate_table: standard]
MELAPPFHFFNQFTDHNHMHINRPLCLRIGVEAHLSAFDSTAATVKTQQRHNFNSLCGEKPNSYTYLLEQCSNVNELDQIHGHMITGGLGQNIFLLTKLLTMYVMCGSMENARLIFDRISTPDVFIWNEMIRGYAMNGPSKDALNLYYQMLRAGMQPNNFTFPFVLKACDTQSALHEGKEIHDYILRTGFGLDVFVATALIGMYANCGSIENARQVFDRMSKRDLVSWSTMIAGYAKNGEADQALSLFRQMQLEGLKPNFITMGSVLQACTHLGALQQGKSIHCYIIRSEFDLDAYAENSLVAMYAKCGAIDITRRLFDNMSKRDVVSWSAVIAGYAHNHHANEALRLFHLMQASSVKPNTITMVGLLPACAQLGALQQGKMIHGYIIRNAFESDIFVGTALLDVYAKCGSIETARLLFDKMSTKNIISWNAMIAACAQSGHANEALIRFKQMQLAGMKPNSNTVATVLPACGHLAVLQQGKCIHGYIVRNGLESDVFVGTALVDMYAKCGIVKIARQLFEKMFIKNVVTWNAMIAGYGIHGRGKDALALFSQMRHIGLKPNDITFVSILSACSHAGLVDEGWQYFNCMTRDYCIVPRAEHYACMVDLLGRAGQLDEAQKFIDNMPIEPSASVWGALLGACRIHCNIELGEHVAERLFDMEPGNSGCYVLLSNIYSAAGRWDAVAKLRRTMKDIGLKKTPGCSLIEVDNRVHTFLVGDRSHPQSEKIYSMLESLTGQMKEVGYVPNTNFVLHDVEEEVKEHLVSSHSEKLAIAFGLINTSDGTPIRITKNLRVCDDCHTATKFISKVVRREIIVRDANRFHHFKDGLCSCRDYW